MALLSISLDIEQNPWTDLRPSTPAGALDRIGLLRHGTKDGKASVAVVVSLPDGRKVVGETTWALLRNAVAAMAASPIVAEEVIDP